MDLQQWRQATHDRLAALAHGLRQAGPGMLYGVLSAATLFPLVEATNQAASRGDVAALMALGSLAGNIGGNLIAEQISRWRDRSEAELAAELESRAQQDPEWRQALDALLREFEAPRVVQAILSEADKDWFVDALRAELARVGSRLTVAIDNDGVLVMGERNVTAGAISATASSLPATRMY